MSLYMTISQAAAAASKGDETKTLACLADALEQLGYQAPKKKASKASPKPKTKTKPKPKTKMATPEPVADSGGA